MEENLRLYTRYQVCRNLLFWLPVFFLYFSSRLALDEVLALEAIYYACVVLLEVPSGYFSDRVGRRVTLIIAMATWSAACFVFAASSSFAWFAAAQLLLACGMAFNSGTDSSLLYDSLRALGREDEFGQREAIAQGRAFLAAALAAFVGGVAGGFDPRIAYVLSGLGGAAALLLAVRFSEPPRGGERALAPIAQVRAVVAHARDPVLAWMFVFGIVMVVLNHVPYEFFQPYLGFLFEREGVEYQPTPGIAGALVGVMMLLSAWASGWAIALRDRLGTTASLLVTTGIQLTTIAAMGSFLHVAVIALIALRSVPGALMTPIMNAAVHPRLGSGLRATYLSVQSLAGRLAFSATLALGAWSVGGTEELTPGVMSGLFGWYVSGGLVIAWGLALFARAVEIRARRMPPS